MTLVYSLREDDLRGFLPHRRSYRCQDFAGACVDQLLRKLFAECFGISRCTGCAATDYCAAVERCDQSIDDEHAAIQRCVCADRNLASTLERSQQRALCGNTCARRMMFERPEQR